MNDSRLPFGFLASAVRFPNRPALEVEHTVLSYAELHELADSIARTLMVHELEPESRLTAVFGHRSIVAFAGVLGALLRGHGYVPLNRTFPADRSGIMLRQSGCRAVIVDEDSVSQLDEVLRDIKTPLLLLFPRADDVSQLAARWTQHRVLGRRDLVRSPTVALPTVFDPDSVAYLLFTSGSTGNPKGVMVSHRNARHYIRFIADRFAISEEDRFSQTFDMTFDLSVADMFVAWERGACVCCPSAKTLINPGRFINDARLTVWFSVPSTVVFMRRFGTLKPGSYPNLRVSMFCGEALTVDIAESWAEAAPQSIVENLYGPTELTIACTYYRWDRTRSPLESSMGVVPIGTPFPRMTAIVVDELFREVQPGETGELLMTGPQLSLGYWRDPEKTAAAFVRLPGQNEVFYRTGDRVRRPVGSEPLQYVGRMDNQIKILGHRVELGEVEAVVRAQSGVESVVAVGWPQTPAGADGIEVFLQTDASIPTAMEQAVEAILPHYMVPRRYHCVARFPLNANGKYDRKALAASLGEGA